MKNLVRVCLNPEEHIIVSFENGLPRIGETILIGPFTRKVVSIEYMVFKGSNGDYFSQATIIRTYIE